MKKDFKIYFEHIIQSIILIEEYSRDKTKNDFMKSTKLQDAIIRRIEIIGEAIKNVPQDFKEANKEIPWKEISGMRDILIHQYFGIDLNLAWEVVITDIPALKNKVMQILRELKK